MIIYNTSWLDALSVSREAKRWNASNIISVGQYASIKAKYVTPLYTPNLFIRIALFFFSYIALTAVYGMAFTVVGLAGGKGMGIFTMIMGGGSFVLLELLVRQRNLYKAGIDDALLYASLGCMIGSAVWLYLEQNFEHAHWVVPWLMALPFLVWGVVRFADRIVTVAAYVCVLGIVFTPLFEGGAEGKGIIPFVAMVVGAVSYFLTRKYKTIDAMRPYEECFYIVEVLALATFYAGGNYLVVRMGNEELMGGTVPEGGNIPLAWLFYALTALTPVAYVVRGLMIRDHLLLRTGLIAAVLSVLTFRYYFHLIPPEVALTVAGLVLFLVAMFATRHLKTRRDGYTDKHLLKEKLKGLDAEALLISQTLGASPQAQPSGKKLEGGGGEFGGGEASGGW